jgi:hypothetical protein
MRSRLFGLLAVLCAVLAVVVAAPLTAFAGQPQHGTFDDSRYPHSFGSHGDPAVGVPSSANGNSGYYYLNVFVGSGGTVHAAIWTNSGRWRIDIDDGYVKRPLKQVTWSTTPDETSLGGLRPGQFIRVRFANESGTTRPDHASAYATDSCALVGSPGQTSRVSASARCGPDVSSTATAPQPPDGQGSSQPSTSSGAPAPGAARPGPQASSRGKAAPCGAS